MYAATIQCFNYTVISTITIMQSLTVMVSEKIITLNLKVSACWLA